MPTDPRTTALLQRLQADDQLRPLAAQVLEWYHTECLSILSAPMMSDVKNRRITEAADMLYAHLANLVEPMAPHTPALTSADFIPLIPHLGDRHQLLCYTVLRRLVDQWDTVQIRGFISMNQTGVHELLGLVEQARQLIAHLRSLHQPD